MTDDLPARVAALELLVEQLIMDRAKKRARPQADVRAITERVAQIASDRPDLPQGSVSAAVDVLTRVMNRLGGDGPAGVQQHR